MKIGFVVNPIAGMGGPVGLKGTDGDQVLSLAMERGAHRSAPGRALAALITLRERGVEAEFLTSPGEMGAAELESAGIGHRVVGKTATVTNANDTRAAVEMFVTEGVDLIVFAGGDGTARDVLEASGGKVPMVGIPCGVKMHSAVFVNTPSELADLVSAFSVGRATRQAEVMDVDEEGFREGVLRAKLHGYAPVPDDPSHMQSGKEVYHTSGADEEAAEIGQYIADEMRPGALYIVGPGSTTAQVAKAIGQEKTILGVDVYLDRRLLKADVTEDELLDLLKDRGDAVLVITPIGAQGFFLGRGNQQLSAKVVRAAGKGRLCIVATPTKLAGTPTLRVDTGDPLLDAELRGDMKVVTGYRRRRLVRVL